MAHGDGEKACTTEGTAWAPAAGEGNGISSSHIT